MAGRIVCGGAIFLGAVLLFAVQPVAVGLLLPRFGGSAGVWAAAMLFFQMVLLAGYWYAHWTTRWLPHRVQLALHTVLAAVSLAFIPVRIAPTGATSGPPAIAVMLLLFVAVGMPCFILAATSPLVQAWLSGESGRVPYALYAVSNAGSLLALLAYPTVIEGALGKSDALKVWSAGYAVFVLLMGGVAVLQRRVAGARASIAAPHPHRWLWLALSATTSVLWIAVANQVSQSVAPVPLLWILPLTIYLLSMVLCFSTTLYRRDVFRWLFPMGVIALVAAVNGAAWKTDLLLGIALFNGGLFVCCMVCHGELYRLRPKAEDLTSFYRMVAAGGVLGAAFVSLAAPRIFSTYLELPIAIVGCVLLAIALLYERPAFRGLIRIGAIASAALVATALAPRGEVWRERNFYGALSVREEVQGGIAYRAAYSGPVIHGLQFLEPARARECTTYYGRSSGIGQVLSAPDADSRRVGIIGLGAGTIAAYGRTGDRYVFYELDPAVVQLAREQFGFLRDSAATIEIEIGDARRSLERQRPQNFDVLAVDAFTGDAIPVHLLTREAFQLYLLHTKAAGVVAVHITNRYLDLAAVVCATAASLGRGCETVANPPDPARGVLASTWVLLDASTPSTRPGPVWTDERNSLFRAFR